MARRCSNCPASVRIASNDRATVPVGTDWDALKWVRSRSPIGDCAAARVPVAVTNRTREISFPVRIIFLTFYQFQRPQPNITRASCGPSAPVEAVT